jgi:cytochrome c5
MKKNLFSLSFFMAILFFIGACEKESTTTPAATKLTYDKDIKSIFTTSCKPCHNAGGTHPKKYDDYATAKSTIDVILERVQRAQTATGFMPLGGNKLDQATIDKLKQWKTDGLGQ